MLPDTNMRINSRNPDAEERVNTLWVQGLLVVVVVGTSQRMKELQATLIPTAYQRG